jgi:hypothetical protein
MNEKPFSHDLNAMIRKSIENNQLTPLALPYEVTIRPEPHFEQTRIIETLIQYIFPYRGSFLIIFIIQI